MAHLLLCTGSRMPCLPIQASFRTRSYAAQALLQARYRFPPLPPPLPPPARPPRPASQILPPCPRASQFHALHQPQALFAQQSDDDAPNTFLPPQSAPDPPIPEPPPQWNILERWNVPWDGTTTVVGMLSWLFSFVLTGLVVSLVAAQLGIGRRQGLDLDEQATFILFHQLVQTIAGLGAVSLVLGRYKPLPPQLFSYEFRAPFDLRRGWILYGGLGLLGATASVLAASTLVVELTGQPPPREDADALLQLLPIIGASPASTASLIFVTGVLAPLLEETVFRGFFLTSLTKWVPTPVAIVVSACAFAGAHLTPGEFPQLVALGIVLGLAYAQTRTLATPMLIHSLWNSGVIIVLTILRLQGYDIKELL